MVCPLLVRVTVVAEPGSMAGAPPSCESHGGCENGRAGSGCEAALSAPGGWPRRPKDSPREEGRAGRGRGRRERNHTVGETTLPRPSLVPLRRRSPARHDESWGFAMPQVPNHQHRVGGEGQGERAFCRLATSVSSWVETEAPLGTPRSMLATPPAVLGILDPERLLGVSEGDFDLPAASMRDRLRDRARPRKSHRVNCLRRRKLR